MCPSCDIVGGVCNETTNVCECKDGYVHGHYGPRSDDCSIPLAVMQPVVISSLILTSLALLYALWGLRFSKGLLRAIAITNTANTLLSALGAVPILVNRFRTDELSMVLSYILISATSMIGFLSFFSMAAPFCEMEDYPEVRLKKIVKSLFLGFRILQLIPLIGCLVATTNQSWNSFFLLHMFFAGLELSGLTIKGLQIGFRLLLIVQILDGYSPNPKSAATKSFLRCIRIAMIMNAVSFLVFAYLYINGSFWGLMFGYSGGGYWGGIPMFFIGPAFSIAITYTSIKVSCIDDGDGAGKGMEYNPITSILEKYLVSAKSNRNLANHPEQQDHLVKEKEMQLSAYVTSAGDEIDSKVPLESEFD